MVSQFCGNSAVQPRRIRKVDIRRTSLKLLESVFKSVAPYHVIDLNVFGQLFVIKAPPTAILIVRNLENICLIILSIYL